MDTLQDAYKDSEEEIEETPTPNSINPTLIEHQSTLTEPQHEPFPKLPSSDPEPGTTPITTSIPTSDPKLERIPEPIPDPMSMDSPDIPTTAAEQETEAGGVNVEPLGSEDASSGSLSEDEQNPEMVDNSDKKLLDNEEDPEEEGSSKKHKSLFDVDPGAQFPAPKKKSSKKKSKGGNSVWTKSTSRKGKKKGKNVNTNNNNNNNDIAPKPVDTVFVAPVPRFPDRNDDSPDAKISLSKVYKAEKVELSEDRMSAGSCKGYRMVRATRGVSEGAWYFEVKLVSLGESGHTRLGWSTEKGDLQAPVGYDSNSFGYRDIDGSKIHKALRQKYGEEGYNEGDVIGFYINLPDGDSCAPKPPHLVWYKGQKYVCAPDPKEDPPKIIPGSEMSFFKNGLCQGVAFKDLYGGRYYPAASMYTLPNQPNCMVKFNFGPDFDCFPVDFGERPIPKPMIEVPYQGFDNRVENGVE